MTVEAAEQDMVKDPYLRLFLTRGALALSRVLELELNTVYVYAKRAREGQFQLEPHLVLKICRAWPEEVLNDYRPDIWPDRRWRLANAAANSKKETTNMAKKKATPPKAPAKGKAPAKK